ncbi:DUF3108 domain-containing protein [Pelomonas sp. UHG3]|uniref:DUF3108 domain-containing protein n=1 Tax=Roseateles hydrophilus TaxID=2975054 RepID=A0ACC6CEN3_9BURK|nr:DUF3108 domain-containing protein [Pelomonas sp. UHG3]MCY4746822.1 DUF3108 domain-containing protein [Pelomonas sp. UHG3]
MKTPRPPAVLVLAVLALHLLLGQEVQRIQDGWRHDGPPMPRRLQVEFVQEMQLQLPPPARRVATAPPVPVRVPAPRSPAADVPAQDLPPPPAPAASAPVVASAADAASAPAGPVMPAAVAASGPASDEPGPEWPLSTRLSYAMTGSFRGGPIHGQAHVEWLRQGAAYQVHLDVSAGPSFAPFFTRRISSQGQLTPDGIAPQRYDEEEKRVLLDGSRATVFFLGAEVQLAHGVRQPLARGAQDSASQFVQLTWLFLTGREALQAGRRVEFPLVLPRRQYAWQYEVVGETMVDTPMGPLASWHLRPTQPMVGGDLAAELWVAPALQYLPVRLLIRQSAETVIDLTLKSAPLQAAPESPNDIPRRLSP